MHPDQSKQIKAAVLGLRDNTGIWQGETDYFLVRVSDATLHRHIAALLEAKGITEASPEQYREALAMVRKLSYWEDVAIQRDPDV